jgi:hypothetical protein
MQMPLKPGETGTVSSSGTLTLVFGWQPPSWLPSQKPPGKTLSIRAGVEAVVDQTVGDKALSFSSVTLDDGYGSPQKILKLFGASQDPAGYKSSSNHLLSADVSTAKFNNGK